MESTKGGPEGRGNDAEIEILEDKRKMTLFDCLSHGQAKWPDAGITASHVYVCRDRVSHPHGSITLRRNWVSLRHPPNVQLPSSTRREYDTNLFLLITLPPVAARPRLVVPGETTDSTVA